MKIKKISALAQILIVCFLASTPVFSQNTPDRETVYFRVTVVDKKGRTVNGLKKENFAVREGKAAQEISYFSDAEEPASVAVLFDISDSVDIKSRQIAAKTALKFLKLTNEENDYSLIAFGNAIYPLLDWGSTDDQVVDVLETLAKLKLKPESTSFYDACFFALDKFDQSRHRKKILLILSDGINNTSKKSFSRIEKRFKASDALVYAISMMSSVDVGTIDGMKAQNELEKIATLSGGKSFYPASEKEALTAVERIAATLKDQYLIGYLPKASAEKEDWREVEIKVILLQGGKVSLDALTRAGYYKEKRAK
jgi:Ca-activated chloride channel family protein